MPFAELLGIKYPTFAVWLQRRRRKEISNSPALGPVQWVEVVVTGAPTSGGVPPLSLHQTGGTRLELVEVKQVSLAVALLRALGLEQPC